MGEAQLTNELFMYKGGCFHPKPSLKREVGELTLKPEGLTLNLSNSQSYSLPYKDLHIKIGGAGNKIVFFSCKEKQEGLVLYSKELSILKDPFWDKRSDCKEVREQIETFNKERQRVKKLWSLGILISLVLFFGIYRGLISLKRSLIQSLPLTIEKKLGDLIVNNLLEQGVLLKNSKKNKKVSELLTFFNPNQITEFDTITLHFSPRDEVNAYALPGGHIVLNKGLILKASRLEEVLGVLAHEMAHVEKRHILSNTIDSIGIFGAFQLFMGDLSGLTALFVKNSSFLIKQKFSRNFEREADQIGFELLTSSGIDPRGLKDFFKRLKQLNKNQPITFLSSHPRHEKRIKFIEKLWKTTSLKKIKTLNYDFDKLKEVLK